MATSVKLPLVVIVGPTASGKTGLSIKLAKQFGGEIISADSRAVYRYMDTGTAKPTIDEQDGVPHWGIDLVDPGDTFTAADFKVYAESKIDEIRARGKIPFLVGGTGLYVDSVLLDFSFCKRDEKARASFEGMTIAELHNYCAKNNIALPENAQNKRYVINAIVRNGQPPKGSDTPRDDAIVVGITTDSKVLRQRIDQRANDMFLRHGVIDETRAVGGKYGWDSEAMSANVYRYAREYIDGRISLESAIEHFKIADWHLAKRQLTWFKRRTFIRWLELDEAHTTLTQVLAHPNNSWYHETGNNKTTTHD